MNTEGDRKIHYVTGHTAFASLKEPEKTLERYRALLPECIFEHTPDGLLRVYFPEDTDASEIDWVQDDFLSMDEKFEAN